MRPLTDRFFKADELIVKWDTRDTMSDKTTAWYRGYYLHETGSVGNRSEYADYSGLGIVVCRVRFIY